MQAIAAGNADRLAIQQRLGKGTIWAPPVYSPDGAFLAVFSTTGAHLYDSRTLQEISSFPTQGWAELAAFSPQGDLLVTGSQLHVTLYDLPSGAVINDPQAPAEARYLMDLAFSTDGKLLAAGYGDGMLRVWSVANGELQYTGDGNHLDFSPDSRLLAAVQVSYENPSQIYLYDTASGERVHEWQGERATFTAQGLLVIESGGAVRMIDPATWKTLHAFSGSQAAVSPDGASIALAAQNTVEIWDTAGESRTQVLEGNYGILQDLQFSPDGQTLAGSVNLFDCCVSGPDTTALWNIADGSLLTSTLQYYLHGGAFSPDGTAYMTGGRFGVDLLDSATGALLGSLDEYSSAAAGVAFDPEGDYFAAAYGEPLFNVHIWETSSGQLVQRLLDEGMNSGAYSYLDLAFSPDGKFMALRGDIWEVESGKQLQKLQRIMSEDHSFWASSIDFQPGSNLLATGSFDGYLALWNLDSFALEGKITGATGEVVDLDYSSDGSLLAAVTGYPEYKIHLWAMPEGKLILSLDGEAENYVGVSIAPDGQSFATLTRFDEVSQGGYVRLWRSSDGQMLWQSDLEDITSIAFSPDGKLIAAGDENGALEIVRVEDGSLIASLPGHSGMVSGVAFSPDGSLIITSSGDGTVFLWGLTP